jgi:hypothetical protein
LTLTEFKGNVQRYKPPILPFNPYLNASDLLEDFIKEVGKLNVRQDEFLSLPIKLFIQWLIQESALHDGEDKPQEFVEASKQLKYNSPRCLYCGRYISKKFSMNGVNFCNPDHMQKRILKCQL